MCGIAGILNYSGATEPVNAAELGTIRDAMASRGPDGQGLWMSPAGDVGLAHRRLSLLDVSEAGAQPMHSADGRLVITYNGEIYNFRELRAQLQSRGCVFRSGTDTEVLLHLYAQKGEDMLADLRGMYAFGIWDSVRRELFLARDPFGIKPLFYSDNGKSFRFASQVKALAAGGNVDTRFDPAGQAGFFVWGYVPAPFTIYRGIRVLPAGCKLLVKASGPEAVRAFFSVPEFLANSAETDVAAAQRNPQETIASALWDTVRHHLIADVPVGVFLSAGIDSSTVTSAATVIGHSSLRTVTLGFSEYRGTQSDETILANVVAKRLGAQHQSRFVSREEFENDLNRLLGVMDQPTIDGVNTYFVAKATTESGLKAALSGLGGDELFGGYESFRQIPTMVNLLHGFPAGAGRLIRRTTSGLIRRFTSPKYASLFEHGGHYGGAYLLRRALFMPWELPQIMDPELAAEGLNQLEDVRVIGDSVTQIKSPRLRVCALELMLYMRQQLLRDSDWAGMAHSLEIRVPLVDVHFLRTIAPLLASAQPPTKKDFAAAAPIALPDEVLSRSKTGFTVPVRTWITQMTGNAQQRGLRGWATYLVDHFTAPTGASSAQTKQEPMRASTLA